MGFSVLLAYTNQFTLWFLCGVIDSFCHLRIAFDLLHQNDKTKMTWIRKIVAELTVMLLFSVEELTSRRKCALNIHKMFPGRSLRRRL